MGEKDKSTPASFGNNKNIASTLEEQLKQLEEIDDNRTLLLDQLKQAAKKINNIESKNKLHKCGFYNFAEPIKDFVVTYCGLINLSIIATIGFFIWGLYKILSETGITFNDGRVIVLALLFIIILVLLWVKKDITPEKLRCHSNIELAKLNNSNDIKNLCSKIEVLTEKIEKFQPKS